MPIYEYQCARCGKSFEYMQSIKEAPKDHCEECGGELSRLISQTSFILKGGGWYKDLYASPKGGSGSGSSSGSSSGSTSGSSSGSTPASSSGSTPASSSGSTPAASSSTSGTSSTASSSAPASSSAA